LNRQLRIATANSWDTFLRNVRAWNIQQVEFSSSLGNERRRIRWLDPAARLDERCRWSVSVSLPTGNGNLCELRAAGPDRLLADDDADALITLMKQFGTQLAAHPEQVFGPAVIQTAPERRRKAA
jgi:hypothetical protein